MGENEARLLVSYIQDSNLRADVKERLFDAVMYAVRYGQMVDVLIDADIRDGNRELHDALWEATNFRISPTGHMYKVTEEVQP